MPGIHVERARGPDGMRLYAIGDVHGRLDLLEALHDRIFAEIAADRPRDWRVVHLGDYVDRGPESKGVVERLIRLQQQDRRVLALAGNHELGFLEFLDRPSPQSLFADFGGETAKSYGVELDLQDEQALRRSHEALLKAVPNEHVDFMGALPRSLAFGDFFFCHAGVRPGVALERQAPDDLIWIREPFLDYAGLLPKVVVHGHTPATRPEMLPHRINVDTGAYYADVLTAVAIEGDEKRFLQVRS